MNNGWRWITPTQSRIGMFSVTRRVEEAPDIGLKFVVDFDPKYNEKPFKTNSCTIGMSFFWTTMWGN